MLVALIVKARVKTKSEQLPCERFLQDFEFSRLILSPVSHRIKRGKFQKPVKIAHKAVILILFSLKVPVDFSLVSKIISIFVSILFTIDVHFSTTSGIVIVHVAKTPQDKRLLTKF